jgi:transposase-like protein
VNCGVCLIAGEVTLLRPAFLAVFANQNLTSEVAAKMRKLRAENRELKRANEILKSASVFFAAELDRNNK